MCPPIPGGAPMSEQTVDPAPEQTPEPEPAAQPDPAPAEDESGVE